MANVDIKNARSVFLCPYNRHKSCNMLSLLNVLTLKTKLQYCVRNIVFWDKK